MATVACVFQTAHAMDPERDVSQYIRDEWTSGQGFPGGPVYAIAQTPDGYLWIGAEKGLVRFDGLEFRLVPSDAPRAPTNRDCSRADDG